MRKKVICSILAVIIAAGGIGWYVYHSAQVKKQKFAAYTKALKDFRRSAKELTSAAYFIEWDYYTNWRNAIKGEECLDANNKKCLYDDMDDAVSARYAFYKDKFGAYSLIDSCRIALGKHYIKVKDNANEENAKVIPLLENMIKTIDKSIALSKKPEGTLASYGTSSDILTGKLKYLDGKLSKFSPDDDDKNDIRIERVSFVGHGTDLLCGIGSDRKDWEKRSYILMNMELFLDMGL